ncbi:UDP-N-acetylglucosamine 2-epimerase (hydrolyzing), partial [Clostridiales bacterium AHG0011]|nr:UDP-N-acetylglucosamine 2-epimerase (hydrolyzing) [Clostridiales bacterium AHG0011]
AVAVSKAMGLALIGFSEYFEENRPDILLILGDRYEMLAVACAATNAGIPIAHLYGGETTEGALDESIRHAITKLSYLHFTSTIEYRNRVIQMGESPDRVFSVGAIGIENVMCTELYSKSDLEEALNWKLDRSFAIVTYHPVTMESGMAVGQVNELLKALDAFPEMKFIITKANADSEGLSINKRIEDYAHNHANVKVCDSLGMKRYLSALKYADMVIGNSSSGLIEVPSFLIPTINIGNRQKGRLQAESVINCEAVCDCIVMAVNRAMSREFRERIRHVRNPYGDGDTSERVVGII